MRSRNLKPGIFKNELLAVADPLYTVIFEGLWCLADREGRLEDRPGKIHIEINPGRAFETTERALTWLSENGFILRYQIGTGRYIQVITFKDHQNPHQKEPASKIPPPDVGTTAAPDRSGASPVQASGLPESGPADSGFLTPDPGSPIPDSLTPAAAAKSASVVEGARAQLSQAGEMAAALRQRDVTVTSMNPTLIGWIQSGFTVSQVCEAVEIARKTPGKETGSIPPNYLDRILRQPARPPPAPAASRLTWRPTDDDEPCTTPNSTPSAKH